VHCTCGSAGDPRTHGGDLGELRRDLVGDFVAGFGIGNADVPIFVGGIWSRDSVPIAVPEVLWGLLPSIDYADSCS